MTNREDGFAIRLTSGIAVVRITNLSSDHRMEGLPRRPLPAGLAPQQSQRPLAAGLAREPCGGRLFSVGVPPPSAHHKEDGPWKERWPTGTGVFFHTRIVK